MKRGDLVTMAVGGDHGKPRPALVIQADAFADLPSVTMLRLTSDIGPEHLVRVTVWPTPENGLRAVSQIMIDKAVSAPRAKIDKAVSAPRAKIGKVFGYLDDATMLTVSRTLVAFLGLEGVAV